MNSVDYDVCIVGTGAAGGMLAYLLAQQNLRVVSIEQGGELAKNYFSEINPPGKKKWRGIRYHTSFPPAPEHELYAHELYAHTNTRSSSAFSDGVFWQFQIQAIDGLLNLWNGISLRFSAQDFDAWPINYEELKPYYTQVEQLMPVCGSEENLNQLPDGSFIPPRPQRHIDKIFIQAAKRLNQEHTYLIANRKAVETRPEIANTCTNTGFCFNGCPSKALYKFSTHLLLEIKLRSNYHLITNAKVKRLIRNKDNNLIDSLEYIDTTTLETKKLSAKRFVLATGTFETPRILFNSHDETFINGLANSNDRLGRRLQDNPNVHFKASLRKLLFKKPTPEQGFGDSLLLMSKAQDKQGKDFSFIGHTFHSQVQPPYFLAEKKYLPFWLRKHYFNLLKNSYVGLTLFCGADARDSNRVVPSAQSDDYGIKQIDIHYQSNQDTEFKLAKMIAFGKKFLANATAFNLKHYRNDNGTSIHYAGTCHMGNDRKSAVVDANLKSFDHDNLYLCDGSVIPYLPEKHLTLTIMALAARLAHHLSGIHEREKND